MTADSTTTVSWQGLYDIAAANRTKRLMMTGRLPLAVDFQRWALIGLFQLTSHGPRDAGMTSPNASLNALHAGRRPYNNSYVVALRKCCPPPTRDYRNVVIYRRLSIKSASVAGDRAASVEFLISGTLRHSMLDCGQCSAVQLRCHGACQTNKLAPLNWTERYRWTPSVQLLPTWTRHEYFNYLSNRQKISLDKKSENVVQR